MGNCINGLNNCVLFSHLSAKEVDLLFSKIKYSVKSFRKNEVVFCPHDYCDTLGIVLNGSVDVLKIFATGKSLTITRKGPFELIAEASLFSKIQNYPSTIVACEITNIILISKKELLKLFTFDELLMTKFLESVSNRVVALNNTIEILSLNSVTEKIAYYLLLEQKRQRSELVQLSFTKKALAEHINVSRTTLSREFKNLQLKGYISMDGKNIKILRPHKLHELCSN